MVNIDIRCRSPGGAVERRVPCARGGSAGRVGDDVDPVALQDIFAVATVRLRSAENLNHIKINLPSVASPADGVPVREQVALILAIVIGGLDRQGVQLGLGR